jgi:hypothetical protein
LRAIPHWRKILSNFYVGPARLFVPMDTNHNGSLAPAGVPPQMDTRCFNRMFLAAFKSRSIRREQLRQ